LCRWPSGNEGCLKQLKLGTPSAVHTVGRR
jgi:hypothetical protein